MPTKKGKKKDSIKGNIADKAVYRFGKRKLYCLKPKKGYPTADEAKEPFDASLELDYAHGYNGCGPDSRQNLYLTPDGKSLLYYIAAIVVVYDYKTNKQRFFTGHNDDVTALCLDEQNDSTLVASGQTDPIDRPGEGKDLPKVWVWNYDDLSKVELIDKICWGYINKVQWSSRTGYIYVLCGDESQTLKVFDPQTFKDDYKRIEKLKGKKHKKAKSKKDKEKRDACNYAAQCLLDIGTQKEHCSGFLQNKGTLVNENSVDEFLFFCKRKFCYCEIGKGDKDKLKMKFKAISTNKLYKAGEKQFSSACFLNNDGYYAVGAQSGQIYIGKGFDCISLVQTAHLKSVGMLFKLTDNTLCSGGFDRKIVKWSIDKDLSVFKGKKGKSAGLRKLATYSIHIQGSDMVFHPKACAYNANSEGNIFVGTKSNHIISLKLPDNNDDCDNDNDNDNDNDGDGDGDNKDDGKEAAECKLDNAQVLIDGHDDQIWALATHPTISYYVTGGYDNAIKLWNAKTLKCEQTHEFKKKSKDKDKDGDKKSKDKDNDNSFGPKKMVTAAWSNNGKYIAFGTEDSNIAVFTFDDNTKKFNYESMTKIKKKNANAQEENVSYLRFSNNSKYLGVGHMDAQLYIFTIKTNKDTKVVSLIAWKPITHQAAISHLQWSQDSKMVKTFTVDYEIIHWKLIAKTKKGKHELKEPDPDTFKWADDPLPAGWDVQGCYQPEWDGTDLNDLTLSNNGKYVITSDDYGKIRLHPYPAIEPSNCKEYGGHSEFVVGVEMLRNSNTCITCGGNDCAIFHWKAIGLGDDDDGGNGNGDDDDSKGGDYADNDDNKDNDADADADADKDDADGDGDGDGDGDD